MGMELWRGITALAIGTCRCVLELDRYHLAGGDRRVVAATTRLHIFLDPSDSLIDARSVGLYETLIVTHLRREGNRLRGADSRVPCGAVGAGDRFVAVFVNDFAGLDGLNKLLASE